MLRPEHPAWALVPLFYSAMHLMHAQFDRDYLPEGPRHPSGHVHRRTDGQIVSWGTTDVVREHYQPVVSRAYSSLFQAGYSTRYSSPLKGDGQRLWDDYEVVRGFVLGSGK